MNTGTFTVAIGERPARILTKGPICEHSRTAKGYRRKFELLCPNIKIIQENAHVKKDFEELRQKYDQLLGAMGQTSDIKSLLAYIQGHDNCC